MDHLITNVRAVTPGLELANAAVAVKQGKIAALIPAGSPLPQARKTTDGQGLTLLPGFIDVHCHGRNNFDFCDASQEGVNLIARKKLEEGVTTLLPTTLTLPEAELAAALETFAKYDGKGAKLPGVHLEGPFINCKCAGAQNPAFVRKADLEEVKRLNKIFPVRKVSFAPEAEGGKELAAGLRELGIVPSAVHSAASYADFQRAQAAGLRDLSHFCNQMTPLHHRDIGLVGAGLLHDDVFVELICDKLHLAPEMIALVFKIKGAGRIQLISDAMRGSGMPDGVYSLGGLPVVIAGNAARLQENGALAGSTLQLNRALANVAEITRKPLSEICAATSLTAAQSLGLPNVGRLEPGYAADFVLLDEAFNVRQTWVDGVCRFTA